jgi:hypothetical protein
MPVTEQAQCRCREDRPKALGQLAIEIGHMSDDDVNVGDELLDFRPIDLLPLDHRICNAGQSRDGGRYRRRRLLECLKRVDDRDNSIICVCKLDGGDFEHFVAAGVEARSFQIDDQPNAMTGDSGFDGARNETAQDPVIACRLQRLRHRFIGVEIGHRIIRCDRGFRFGLARGSLSEASWQAIPARQLFNNHDRFSILGSVGIAIAQNDLDETAQLPDRAAGPG